MFSPMGPDHTWDCSSSTWLGMTYILQSFSAKPCNTARQGSIYMYLMCVYVCARKCIYGYVPKTTGLPASTPRTAGAYSVEGLAWLRALGFIEPHLPGPSFLACSGLRFHNHQIDVTGNVATGADIE